MKSSRMARNCAVVLSLAGTVGVAGATMAADVTQVPSGRNDLSIVLIEGGIRGGETLQLTQIISRLPADRQVAVILNSPGGNLEEGLKLGRLFHQTRIATFVMGYGGNCHSACSLAFLGGRGKNGKPSRTQMVASELGFHQFRRDLGPDAANLKFKKADMEREVTRARTVIVDIITYLVDIGEDMGKLHLMLQAPTTELKKVAVEEAPTLGINVMDERSQQVIEASAIRARVGQQ